MTTTMSTDPRKNSTLARPLDAESLQDGIAATIPQIIALFKHEDLRIRTAAAAFEPIDFAKQVDLRSEISAAIPSLFELMKDPHPDVRSIAVTATRKLSWEGYGLLDNIPSVIPHILDLVQDEDASVRSAALTALRQLSGAATAFEATVPAVPHFIGLLKSPKAEMREVAVDVLAELAFREHFVDTIKGAVPTVIELLNDQDIDRKSTGLSLIGKILGSRAAIYIFRDAVSVLTKLFKDQATRQRAIELFYSIYSIYELAEPDALVVAIPPLIEVLQDQDTELHTGAVLALTRMANHVELRDAIRPAMPLIIERLEIPDSRTVESTITSLLELAGYTGLVDLISASLPLLFRKIIEVMERQNAWRALAKLGDSVLQGAIRMNMGLFTEMIKARPVEIRPMINFIGDWATHEQLRGAILDIVPWLIELLRAQVAIDEVIYIISKLALYDEDEHRDALQIAVIPLFKIFQSPKINEFIRADAVSAFAQLVSRVKVPDTIGENVSSIIDLLTGADSDGSSVAVKAVVQLAMHAELRDSIRLAVPSLIQRAKESPRLPSDTVSVLITLSDYEEFRETIRINMPAIMELFTTISDHWNSITKLISHTELQPAIQATLPSLISSLRSMDITGAGSMNILAAMAEQAPFRDKIATALPEMNRIMERIGLAPRPIEFFYFQIGFPDFVATVAQYEEFRGALRALIPRLINLLDHKEALPQKKALGGLGALGEYKLVNEMRLAVPKLMTMFRVQGRVLSDTVFETILALAKTAELRGSIASEIPSLVPLMDSDIERWESYSPLQILSELAAYADLRTSMRAGISGAVKLLLYPNTYTGATRMLTRMNEQI